METQHEHTEIICFDVAPIGKHDIILGLLWCKLHQVQFDWDNHDIIGWAKLCEETCFYNPKIAALHTQLLQEDAKPPQQATEQAIGYDLYSTQTVTIPPGS